jgi:beta-glucosidase-like glycosyl hydrolase
MFRKKISHELFYHYLIKFIMYSYAEKLNSTQKKTFQLMINRLDGDKISSAQYRNNLFRLIENNIGGFIIFGGKKNEIKKLILQMQSVADIPLFIASDIERGVAQQINGATHFPSQMAVASAIDITNPEDISMLKKGLESVASECIDIGINMPLIPVMDVNQQPDNPIICTRAFSDNQDIVSKFGSTYIKILESFGIITCAKHFPGHGNTNVDSHISLPVIKKSKKDLMDTDIIPFIHAINAGVKSIMIGHLSVRAFDDKPASLSTIVTKQLLRNELGFRGLIVTDALNMNALKDFGKVPVECLNAGADMLLHPANADEAAAEILHALKTGLLKENTVDAALNRILSSKTQITQKKPIKVDYCENILISKTISEKSITLVKHKPGLLPIKQLRQASVIFAGDAALYENSILQTHTMNANLQTLIIAIFTSVSAWKGSSGIDREEQKKIKRLISEAENSIVISFGSPYVLRHFTEADVLIASYEPSKQAQEAVIKCLTGEIGFSGKLPVELSKNPFNMEET